VNRADFAGWRPGPVVGVASLLGGAEAAWAHGEHAATSPWTGGSTVLFGDPAALLALAVLVLWMAQTPPPRLKPALYSAIAGLATGTAVAAAGFAQDLSLALLAATLFIGGLVAWARPGPALLQALATGAVAAGVVLMLAPAETAPVGDRLAWLAGVVLVTVLLFGYALGLLQVLLGRRPGPLRQMLLRVAGSWLATAALLAGVLELSRSSL
jgi:hypothetical protein